MTTDTTTTRSQEFTDIDSVKVTDERGDVTVRCTTTDGAARVRLTARGDIDLARVELRPEGGALVVDVPPLRGEESGPGFSFRLGPISLDSPGSGCTAVDVDVELPGGSDISARTKVGAITVTGEAGAVTAKSGAGDITVASAGRVRLACGAGDVRVRSCHGGDVTTGAGDILLEEVVGEELQVRAGSGDVRLPHNRTDSVSVGTGSGSVTMHLSQGSFDCRSGAGSVEVIVPRGVPLWLDLSSATGRVTKDVAPVGAPEEGQDHLSVKARTGVGNVSVHH
jgi:hypothetical protein